MTCEFKQKPDHRADDMSEKRIMISMITILTRCHHIERLLLHTAVSPSVCPVLFTIHSSKAVWGDYLTVIKADGRGRKQRRGCHGIKAEMFR